jgi:macrolide transport system ATP-binding/permease protein
MSWFRQLFSRRQIYADFSEEIQQHLAEKIEALMATGMSRRDAEFAAKREFGNVARIEQSGREAWIWPAAERIFSDLTFAVRRLIRQPGFTLTVVVTLALSIGVNTAIFSLVNALLIKTLPYPHPERLGVIFVRFSGPNLTSGDQRTNLDGQMWEQLRDNVPALNSALSAGLTSGGALLTSGQSSGQASIQASTQASTPSASHAEYVHSGRVSAHYFDVLGLQPLMGRNFSLDEDRPGGPRAAILSYALWHTGFNSNPNILGTQIQLKSEPYTVVGVLPQNTITPLDADIYTNLQAYQGGEGGGTNFSDIVRLRDGATWQEADAQINHAFAVRSARFYRKFPGGSISYYNVPLQKAQNHELQPEALALMASAGLILLIACANLAGLTLVHVLRRQSEIATRLALGATSWQIQRQFWIENLLLAVIGGAFGLGTGYVALRGLLHLLPEHFLPVASVSLDGRVLAFTAGVSLLTSIFFGMLPALTTRKVDLRSAIASRTVAGGGIRLRQALIAGEVALTVVLLAAAGLLIRTLVHFETLPPGFNPNGVLAAKASLDDAHYRDPAVFRKLMRESVAAMSRIPGVEDAAVGLNLPYERTLNGGVTISDGPQAGREVGSDQLYVTPHYFATLQMPILAGRDFADSDGPDTQPVAIINQTFARKFFQVSNPADAIGHIVDKTTRIIGVVADTQLSSGLSDDAVPLISEETMYISAAQVPAPLLGAHVWFQPSWIVRYAHPIEGLSAQMQRALSGVDANLPFSGFYSLSDLMNTTLANQRIEVALLTVMAALALLLSAIGIFSLVANMVLQRTREIGIRIALGSSIRQTMLKIGSGGLSASALGLVLGLVLCAFALRAMRSVLYGISVYDAPTMLTVVLTLAVVTILATALPVLKISRVDPAQTLREE